MGAEVITISDPRRGDLGGSDALNLNRNKRSVLLDLSVDAGRRILFELCSRSDVLVENFRPRVKHRLRIGPEAVWEHNPQLVYASISGFGQTGPYADRPGVDQIAEGLGGLMSVTGPPGSGPWRTGIAVSDSGPGRPAGPPPRDGERGPGEPDAASPGHVQRDAGVGAEQIAALVSAGVVATDRSAPDWNS